MTFEEVVAIARDLPGVAESTSYGTPALRVAKKLLARLREDNETLVLLRVDDIEQRLLMDMNPAVYYKTPHYLGHDSILIRLPAVDPEELQELIETSWSRLATKRLLTMRPAK